MKKVFYGMMITVLVLMLVFVSLIKGGYLGKSSSKDVKPNSLPKPISKVEEKPRKEAEVKTLDEPTREDTENTESKPNPRISNEISDKSSQDLGEGEKRILNVSQQVQRTPFTCAPTTVSMMLSLRGVTVSQEELANEMGTDTDFGTHNADAIRVLNRYLFGYDNPQPNQAGYRLATVTTSDVNSHEMALFKERLKQNIKDGYPMYYTFDNARIYEGSMGEHNVIGIGYQLTGDGSDIAYLYYIDPSYTKQDAQYGGLKKVTPEELFYAMLTCVEPNYAW